VGSDILLLLLLLNFNDGRNYTYNVVWYSIAKVEHDFLENYQKIGKI